MIFLTIFILCVIFYTIKFLIRQEKENNRPLELCISSYTNNQDLPQDILGNKSFENPSTINVKIKDNNVDTNRIIAYTGNGIRKFEFRPQTWEQFIAQDEAKKQAQTIIKKVNRGIRGHFILGGLKGCGKTTFVELFAKSIHARLFSYIGRQINEDIIPDIINEINQSTEKNVVLFVDEIDTADWKCLKIFNPIIEQFKINDKAVKPFIFASATINRHLLIKNNPDLLDRIEHSISFVRYTADNLSTILNQYKQQLYEEDNITPDTIYTIATSCKYTPRIAISLLEDFVVEQNIKQVLDNRHITVEGLDMFDIKVLDKLSVSKRALGSNALALQIGISEQSYLREIEPYLLEFGYIQRVPSRIITLKGLEILKQIKEK